MRCESGAAARDVQRSALLRARFREHQGAALEPERERDLSRELRGPVRSPLQPSGDHEMKDEPDVVVEADRDALTEPLERDDGRALDRVERRIDAAEQKRRENARAL